jgi:hypothetical protein
MNLKYQIVKNMIVNKILKRQNSFNYNLILVISFILILNLNCKKKVEEDIPPHEWPNSVLVISSTPENTKEKIIFFKENLKVGKKYKPSDDINLFKKVLLSQWSAMWHSMYEGDTGGVIIFKEDGTYVLVMHPNDANLEEKNKGNGFLKAIY